MVSANSLLDQAADILLHHVTIFRHHEIGRRSTDELTGVDTSVLLGGSLGSEHNRAFQVAHDDGVWRGFHKGFVLGFALRQFVFCPKSFLYLGAQGDIGFDKIRGPFPDFLFQFVVGSLESSFRRLSFGVSR